MFGLGVMSKVFTKCISIGLTSNLTIKHRYLHVTYVRNQEQVMNVFDRQAKRIQRNRSALVKDYKVYEYLKEEVGWRVADRISDVKREFGVCLDIGCGRGYVSRHIYKGMVKTMYQMEMAELLLEQAEKSPEIPTHNIVGDEECLPFKASSLDLVTSSLSLHWVNDLPGAFKQIHNALKNDGCFMGSLFGGDTLFELRSSLQLAETEREGGLSPHISPFTSIQDLGNLLNRAGFVMLTIDVDEIVIRYPSMYELMHDLKGMAENNCVWTRRIHLPRATQALAAEHYEELYSVKDKEGVAATFQIISFIGWKPDPSQKGPARRGSGQVSFKDLDKITEISKELENTKEESKTFKNANNSTVNKDLEHLTNELERLRTSIKDDDDNDSGGNK